MKAAEEQEQREREEEKRQAAQQRKEEKRREKEVRIDSTLMGVHCPSVMLLNIKVHVRVCRRKWKDRGRSKGNRRSRSKPVNITVETCCCGEDCCHGNA